ncbi:phosphoribosyltransferase family protein [Luteipulveratus flavus]|uniref:Phosphoribosyltransferase family protein n=1 Tax=Luteipulveratus flavus TaxID=3031728 RepID=A0ABT6C2K7_9MICO|nr:phosphoribosyltransferase family protein [Luteipulveratus sp. YIM 133296]MDF8263062.1 phosphoribosyltransferase family protein [Luteipulveratus sp. YIM 133296]
MDNLTDRLRERFVWLSDPAPWPEPEVAYADPTGWWRDPHVLGALGPALAGLFDDEAPTAVLGPTSRGAMVGALVAAHLGVGLIEARKDPGRGSDDDPWWIRTTGPDYRDRNLRIGVRRKTLRAGDRVLFVDDWVATGGQALACQQIVADSGAHWVGAAVIVDALERSADRRRLGLRGLVYLRDL